MNRGRILVRIGVSANREVMRPLPRLVVIIVAVLTALPEYSLAALCNTTAGTKHEFEFLSGYSPTSATLIGRTEDRKFLLVQFSYSYRCWTIPRADVSYTVGVLPAAFLLQPAMADQSRLTPTIIPAHAVYSVGVLPIGFTIHFSSHRIQPFFAVHGGAIASTEPIPVDAPNASALNFLVDFGPGMRFKVNDRHAITAGYKFLHISNAYTTNFNPGVDNNIFFVGFSFLR